MARTSIPFVFEVPTTIEALHDLISHHATTGVDASLIIERIHAANSVKSDRRNTERMQNFCDVLLRRFVLVGDALYEHGDEEQIGRHAQLDALTRILYRLAQDDGNSSAAVRGRRLGVHQQALEKLWRDYDHGEISSSSSSSASAWPGI